MFKFKNSNITTIVLCGIVLSFSVGGLVSTGFESSNSNDTVGWAGNTPIKNYEFEKYRTILESENPKIKPQEVIKKIAERKALLNYATDYMNLRVSDESLSKYIKGLSIYQENGVFDQNKYLNEIKKTNLAVSDYEKVLRENLLLQNLMTETLLTNTSQKSLSILKDSVFNEKEVKFYSIDYTKIPVDINIDEMKKSYNENTDYYKTNPSFETTTLNLYKDDDYYKNAYEKYKLNPINIYKTKQILVKNEETKDNIINKINKNNFNDFVVKYSIDSYSKLNNGNIGYLRETEFTPEFKTAFNNKNTNSIFFVKSPLGYHILMIDKKINKDITLEEYKNIFKNDIDNEYKEKIVKNEKLNLQKTNEFPIFKDELEALLGKEKVIKGDRVIGNFAKYIQVIKVGEEIPTRKLDINNKNDYELIKNLYKKRLQIIKGYEITNKIEAGKNIDYPWLKVFSKNITKKSDLDQKYIDLIYSTPIDKFNDYIDGNNIVLFKVEKNKKMNIKNLKFQDLMKNIYFLESGNILLQETKDLYPIKINKNLLK